MSSKSLIVAAVLAAAAPPQDPPSPPAAPAPPDVTVERPVLTSPPAPVLEGAPPRAETGIAPATVEPTGFDKDRALPWPTAGELASTTDAIRRRLEMLATLPAVITSEQAFTLIPELRTWELWVSDECWTIDREERTGFWSEDHGRMDVYLGATLLTEPLDRIRRHQRDFVAYLDYFREDYEIVFPVAGTYTQAGCGTDAWVYLEVFGRFKELTGCPSHDGHLHMLEHWARNHLVIEYYDALPDSRWLAGRDTWLMVRDGAEFVGWLVVMEFGFDIDDCWDRAKDVRDSIRKNLAYTRLVER